VIVALNQSVASNSGRVSIEKENLSFCASVFQAGFSEWLSGVSPKETEIAWDEIRNHSYTRLQQCRRLDHCIWVPMNNAYICGRFRCRKNAEKHCSARCSVAGAWYCACNNFF